MPLLPLSLLAVACGGSVYQPSRAANFDVAGTAEINDEDVKKAFDAKPQMPAKANVAYFTFDAEKSSEIEGVPQDGGTHGPDHA